MRKYGSHRGQVTIWCEDRANRRSGGTTAVQPPVLYDVNTTGAKERRQTVSPLHWFAIRSCANDWASKLLSVSLRAREQASFRPFVRSDCQNWMERTTQTGESGWREKQCWNSRPSEEEWTGRQMAAPSASSSVILVLRPTAPSSMGLLGQRNFDVQPVHFDGKKDFNVVQGSGFSGSPSCTSRLIENMESTWNDSDVSTTTDDGTIKAGGEGSTCHNACEGNDLKLNGRLVCVKEYSLKARLSNRDLGANTQQRELSSTWCP